MIINGTYYYHHYDPIGNVLFVTDASGNRNTSYVQEGFGNVVSQSGSANNNYHLTTKEIDSDTGLYYFYARWYDAGVGRFVSRDPLGFIDGPNLYAYVKNNPINNLDPTGESILRRVCKEVCKIVCIRSFRVKCKTGCTMICVGLKHPVLIGKCFVVCGIACKLVVDRVCDTICDTLFVGHLHHHHRHRVHPQEVVILH